VSANHSLQNFLSAENFPEWKWALEAGKKDAGGDEKLLFFFTWPYIYFKEQVRMDRDTTA
jgi:hypothetical protein